MNTIDSLGIYIKGDYAGVDNESACDIIERAVAEGVKSNAGQKNAMSIALGAIWLEGFMAGCGATDENVKSTLREAINKYFFI